MMRKGLSLEQATIFADAASRLENVDFVRIERTVLGKVAPPKPAKHECELPKPPATPRGPITGRRWTCECGARYVSIRMMRDRRIRGEWKAL